MARQWQVEQVVSLAPLDTSLQGVAVADGPTVDLKLGLRGLLPYLGEREFRLFGTAAQVLECASNHRFCGRRGARTHPMPGERGLPGVQRGLAHYPRVC